MDIIGSLLRVMCAFEDDGSRGGYDSNELIVKLFVSHKPNLFTSINKNYQHKHIDIYYLSS